MPLRAVEHWVREIAHLAAPDRVIWIDGSDDLYEQLTAECLSTGELIELNQSKLPGCYLHRSNANDVARTEHLTFIATERQEDAGPNNNWLDVSSAKATTQDLFSGAMRRRTMFVVPFVMGPLGSEFSQVGVQITDSRYVVLSMRLMTKVGASAIEELNRVGKFTRCVHSLGDLHPDKRKIIHFPDENSVWSIGSGYGGNALLSKKCMALRLASFEARREGWLAEHMMLLGLQNPEGQVFHIAGAFPSGCGKTNLAMLSPPESFSGWKVWTLGDDIAWLRPGEDGRLWATNPEAGFFGILPGTSSRTNPVAFDMIRRRAIYTNCAIRPDGTPWWEGHDDSPPSSAISWRGLPWQPDLDESAAHPNSRFTSPMSECSSASPFSNYPKGVPIDAILFGVRRRDQVPLVIEARSWAHGTFLGATMTSEATSATTGEPGKIRYDPMAMSAFCGYNLGDYFRHWLDVGSRLTRPPRIYCVNWFRTDENGAFLWPGFGENLRVLKWILARTRGAAEAHESAIGRVPTLTALDRDGLGLSDSFLTQLLTIDRSQWQDAIRSYREFLSLWGGRTPPELDRELEEMANRLARFPDASQ